MTACKHVTRCVSMLTVHPLRRSVTVVQLLQLTR